MSLHDFMKEVATQPFESLRNEIQTTGGVLARRKSLTRLSFQSSSPTYQGMKVHRLDVEKLNTKAGGVITSRRFYVQSQEASEYNSIGWILHDGATNCMLCGTSFGTLQPKHNCSCCGLVACGNCLSGSAMIAELSDQKRHRVCKKCNDGSDVLHAIEKSRRAPRGRVAESFVAVAPPPPSSTADETGSVVSEGGGADGSVMHVSYLKAVSSKSVADLQEQLKKAYVAGQPLVRRKSSFLGTVVGEYTVVELRKEDHTPKASGAPTLSVYRVFISSPQGGSYCELGWIVKDSAPMCMCCDKNFGALYFKYHCRACGNVVCSSCSGTAQVAESGSPKPQRVCKSCNTGEVVHVRVSSTLSREDLNSSTLAPSSDQDQVSTPKLGTPRLGSSAASSNSSSKANSPRSTKAAGASVSKSEAPPSSADSAEASVAEVVPVAATSTGEATGVEQEVKELATSSPMIPDVVPLVDQPPITKPPSPRFQEVPQKSVEVLDSSGETTRDENASVDNVPDKPTSLPDPATSTTLSSEGTTAADVRKEPEIPTLEQTPATSTFCVWMCG